MLLLEEAPDVHELKRIRWWDQASAAIHHQRSVQSGCSQSTCWTKRGSQVLPRTLVDMVVAPGSMLKQTCDCAAAHREGKLLGRRAGLAGQRALHDGECNSVPRQHALQLSRPSHAGHRAGADISPPLL